MQPFSHRLRVRYNECDAQGVVFNANHFVYFDIALTEFWRETFGSYQAMVDSGADMMVREATATYHASPRFDDELDLHVSVAHVGTTSLQMRIEERRAGELLVEGRIVYVFIDPATAAKRPIPDDVRAKLTSAPS